MPNASQLLDRIRSHQISDAEASRIFSLFPPAEQAGLLSQLQKALSGERPDERPNRQNGAETPSARRRKFALRTNQTCTPRQQAFLKHFIESYGRMTRTSKMLAARCRPYLADQRTPANFNLLLKELQYPITLTRAAGAYVHDVDDNRYIDISGDFGVNLFGHAPEFLSQALKDQVDMGLALSGRYEAIGEASALFCELTGQERVTFCQSGTEALMSALRLARAFTDRQTVVVFNNAYHGHADVFLNTYTAGVSQASSVEAIALTYGTEQALEQITAKASELAAVIVEPVQSDSLDLQPVEFLRRLRDLTQRHGIVLVFDEMITGFRAHPRGCQGLFGIEADLATYGKILGGGITAGAVAGRAEIMDWCDGGDWKYGDQSKPGPTTFIAGTHTQNPLKMAATLAVLRELKRQSPRIQTDLSCKTTALVSRLNSFAKREHLPLDVVSFCSQFRFRFHSKQFTLTQALFLHVLNSLGVKYHLHGNCFLTAAHTDEDIDAIYAAIEETLNLLRREGFFYDDGLDEGTEEPAHDDQYSRRISRGRTDTQSDSRTSDLQAGKVAAEGVALQPDRPALPLQIVATRQNQEKIEAEVKRIVGSFLELDTHEFTMDDDLSDLGVDSIIKAKLFAAITKSVGVKLTLKKLAGANTVSMIAQAICREEALAAAPMSDAASNDIARNHQAVSVPDAAMPTAKGRNMALQQHFRNGKQLVSEGGAGTAPHDGRRLNGESAACSSDVAIIGMSGIFPGAANVTELWRNLLSQKSSIVEIPEGRWSWSNVYSQTSTDGCTHSKWGAFVDGHDRFDPLFFRISPREAKYMDPQERLLLMETYKAIEDAGLNMEELAGTPVGVFVGYEYTDYADRLCQIRDQIPNFDFSLDPTTRAYFLANRISFTFDWKGPSEAINVNCASSAVSIGRAWQSLMNRESDYAVAGGVSLNLLPANYIRAGDLLSPDGSCRVFADGANGYTKGEGCAVIVLKRLEDALRDGNSIYAVLKGCHETYRGRGRSLSEVKSEALEEAIGNCYRRFGIPPHTIRYIEVDGYCTKAGDATEYEAIRRVMVNGGEGASPPRMCALGSLKPNIGNLEPAGAVANVVKVAMAMASGQFPATLLDGNGSDLIDTGDAASPLFIAETPIYLDSLRTKDGEPIRAGINSFADSGVNVHIVLEEPPGQPSQPVIKRWTDRHIFVLSARTKSGLKSYIRNWREYIATHPDLELERLAYTTQVGRVAFEHRLACVAESLEELLAQLDAAMRDQAADDCYMAMATSTREANRGGPQPIVTMQTVDPVTIAKMWIEGAYVDWRVMYGESAPMTLHQVPTYPFNLKGYWLEVPHGDGRDPTPTQARQSSAKPSAREVAPSIDVTTRRHDASPPASSITGDLLSVMQRVRSIAEKFLELDADDEMNEAANFSEMGMTSLSIVLFVDELNKQFGLSLPETTAFDFPNLQELSTQIASLQGTTPGIDAKEMESETADSHREGPVVDAPGRRPIAVSSSVAPALAKPTGPVRDLVDKVAFVTGGASGIGLAMGRAFLSAGMKVMLADIERDALDRSLAELESYGDMVAGTVLDVIDRSAMHRAAEETVRLFGKIHVLCNNAGVAPAFGSLGKLPASDWDWSINVNLSGVFNGIAEFLPRIRAHGEGGHVVNTASMAGVLSRPGVAPYCAAKTAVVALSESLATELEGSSIGVTVLCPGWVRTQINESYRNRQEEFDSSGVRQLAASERKALAATIEAGMDPAQVAERVLAAILANDLYVFTHTDMRRAVEQRFANILNAIDRAHELNQLARETAELKALTATSHWQADSGPDSYEMR